MYATPGSDSEYETETDNENGDVLVGTATDADE